MFIHKHDGEVLFKGLTAVYKSKWKKRQVHYYMMPAVFVTLFCFWPTGIMAIMKVTDIDDARRRGDAMYLQTSKSAALKWIGMSVLFGVVVLSSLGSIIGWQIFHKL